MVKSYLRYVPEASYGVILTSGFYNGVALLKNKVDLENGLNKRKYGISISGEHILVIDLMTGVIEKTLRVEIAGRFYSGEGIPSTVHYATAVCEHPNKAGIIAAGYSDGSVRIWNIVTGSVVHVFHGHGKNITALKFCRSGNYLSCGSFDTEVTLWDTLSGKGLYRFSGHLNEITDIEYVHKLKFWNHEKSEMGNKNVVLEDTPHLLITSSKDCTIKIWNIQTQVCMQTLTEHKGEVYSILLNPLCNRLYTAGKSGEISIYRLSSHATGLTECQFYPNDKVSEQSGFFDNIFENKTSLSVYYGRIPRFQGSKYSKVIKLIPKWQEMTELDKLNVYDDFKGMLFAFTNSNAIESFACYDSYKTDQRIKKMIKKKSNDHKLNSSSESNILPGNYEVFPISKDLLIEEDEMIGTRLLGIDFDSQNNTFILGLGNNSIKYVSLMEDYFVSIDKRSGGDKNVKKNEDEGDANGSNNINLACKIIRRIENEGHRGIPREICVSEDDKFIATFGDDTIKIWNMKGFKCVGTIIAENPVCGFIVPGDEHTISGTKKGGIQLHDIINCKLLQSLDNVHDNSVQSLALSPENSSFVSVAQDKKLNLYHFGMKEHSTGKITENRVTIVLTKTLSLLEEGLAVKYTYDGKYLIVSLLDNTIMVLHSDTLKQFLVLYGHSLPVPCLDIAHDNTILASGSADKTIKIWGLDFGNIQRSFHAHSECVTHVKFVRDTHYLVSTSRDGSLKVWDLDKGDLITILHQKSTYGMVPIVSLALTFDGDRIICGFLDRTVRVWFRTDKQLFLEEEREKEEEEHIEKEVLQGSANYYTESAGSISTMSRPTRKTFETLKSTEKLMEVIDIAYNYYIELLKYNSKTQEGKSNIQPPHAPFEIGELSVQEYVLLFIQRISTNYLSEVVWSIPLLYAERLIVLIEYVLKMMYKQSVRIEGRKKRECCDKEHKNLSLGGLEPLVRVVLSLVQTHFLHWVSSIKTISPIVDNCDKNTSHYSNDWTKTTDPRNERLPQYNIRSILFNLKKYIHFLLKIQMDVVSVNNGILKIIEQDAVSNHSMKGFSFNNISESIKNKQAKKRRITNSK